MAICAVVLGLWAFVGIDSIIVFIDYISLLALQHSLWILAIAFLFSLTVSAALWANKQEKADEDAKIKEKRNDAIAKIKVKGFVEDSEIPDKTGWELYIKTLAERLIKSTLNGESFALGISGDWGSGKTTFIDALEILKTLLCGQKVGTELSDCISYGQEQAELQFEFSILKLDKGSVSYRRRLIYSAILSRDTIDETVKCVTPSSAPEKTSRIKTIFECTHEAENAVFLPQVKLDSLFGTKQSAKVNELRVTKLLCQKEHRSFLFSPEFLKMLHDAAQKSDDDVEPLFEIAYFAKTSFFVILNRNNGLISLDAAIPVNFRTETAGGMFTLPIDRPTTIPSNLLEIVRQVISTISMVLCKIIPGVKLTLVELGTELMEDGNQGTKIQLARELLCANGETHRLPLKYESEGIKKITSILHLLIAAYNNPSITLAIDELDSGIYEYLLGELLRIIQNSGKGQLIFTSHNLYPLETLDSDSIVFTTTKNDDRYTRIRSVRATNNLRSMYLREVILGSDNDAALYEETNVSEIAHAMRVVGKRMENISIKEETSSEVSHG